MFVVLFFNEDKTCYIFIDNLLNMIVTYNLLYLIGSISYLFLLFAIDDV